MKVLSVELARSMWLVETKTLNPGGISLQRAFEELNQRYRFSKAPQHPLDTGPENALVFQLGTFPNSQGKDIAVTLSIFTNGFQADTQSSTTDSTEFLSDLSGWLTAKHGLAFPPESEIGKGFLSNLVVKSDGPLVLGDPGIQSVLASIKISSLDRKPRVLQVAGFTLWTEDVGQPAAPAPFKLERRWGEPFANNIYFSQAPFETDAHVRSLSELEGFLKKTR